MPRFGKKHIGELKEFLYNSCVHDAILKNANYNCKDDSIIIELYNPIFNVKMDLSFLNIGIALAIKGDWSGSHETIISLSVEEDYSFLQNYLLKYGKHMEDSLYLMFQLFSGDELHIVSKEVVIEVIG